MDTPFWRGANGAGCVRRRRNSTTGFSFECYHRGEWVASATPGELPHIPCEDPEKPKPRPYSAILRRWLRETGRIAANQRSRLRWSFYTERVEELDECDGVWRPASTKNNPETYVPEDGDPWQQGNCLSE